MGGFKLTGKVRWEKWKDGVLVACSPWSKNQVVANSGNGIYVLLDRLANITTNDGIVKYAELGDDNTAANVADTDLGNGLVRVAVTQYTRSGLNTDFRFFFPDATTPDDTYNEFGMFMDGSATLGSGELFNRLIFGSGLVKATGEDITVVCRVTGSV